MKGKAIDIFITVLIAACGIAGGLYYLQGYESYYYTKIDNTEIKEHVILCSEAHTVKFRRDVCHNLNVRHKE